MKNCSSQEAYTKPDSFSPLSPIFEIGSGLLSVLKLTVTRLSPSSPQIMLPRRKADPEAAARPHVELRVVSRYECDFYGRPRVLSEWEILADALARPVLIGVALGFGLATFLLPVHSSAPDRAQEVAGASALVNPPGDEP